MEEAADARGARPAAGTAPPRAPRRSRRRRLLLVAVVGLLAAAATGFVQGPRGQVATAASSPVPGTPVATSDGAPGDAATLPATDVTDETTSSLDDERAGAADDDAHDSGHGDGEGHGDANALVLLELALVILIAILGRAAATGLRQPEVLGELLIGLVVGNVGYWLGVPLFVLIMNLNVMQPMFETAWASDLAVHEAASALAPTHGQATMDEVLPILTGPDGPARVLMAIGLTIFSSLGIVLLLFLVGLESSVRDMLDAGPRSLAVALVGIVVPAALGYGIGMAMLPDADKVTWLFLGAALAATSVGITAAVFKEMGTLASAEARVILGAAVIDDVLGLIILAVVAGMAATGTVNGGEILHIAMVSTLFLGVVILLGERLMSVSARLFRLVSKAHVKLLFPLTVALLFAWAAEALGMAAIVGAFAAGLILSESHVHEEGDDRSMEDLIGPIERIFAPVFFVLIGMQVNLAAMADVGAIVLASVLSVVAIAGKLVSGLAAGRGVNRFAVGMGMVPRGEVGLIFAGIGKGLGVLDDRTFSAVVIVMILTTLVTPPVLTAIERRRVADEAARAGGGAAPDADPETTPGRDDVAG